MNQPRTHENYEALIYACNALAPMPTVVVHPCDETSLTGAIDAAKARIIRPTLVGPEARIRALAKSLGLDISGIPVVDVPHSADGLALVDAFRRRGLLLAENCQWPFVLPALFERHPALRTAPVQHVAMALGPSFPGRAMVEDLLSTLLND